MKSKDVQECLASGDFASLGAKLGPKFQADLEKSQHEVIAEAPNHDVIIATPMSRAPATNTPTAAKVVRRQQCRAPAPAI